MYFAPLETKEVKNALYWMEHATIYPASFDACCETCLFKNLNCHRKSLTVFSLLEDAWQKLHSLKGHPDLNMWEASKNLELHYNTFPASSSFFLSRV